jgi:anti-sigma regulatory factor (Ser/Thr protein kinase)
VLNRLSRLEFALRNATDVNAVTRALLDDLSSLPHVRRVGLALTEGAGRRLRFTTADTRDDAEDPDDLSWWHIDAYDDVPLTTVARTGESIVGDLAQLAERYPALADHGERHDARVLAVVPLPGVGSPLGGLVVYLDDGEALTEPTRRLLDAAARRASEAVRRVRVSAGRGPDDPAPEQIVPGEGGRRAELVLEGDARAAGLARHFLRDRLSQWGVDPDVGDGAQLCLSELVTNVIMHAGTGSELVVHLEAAVLTVVVRDIGATARPGVPATYLPIPEDDDPLRVFGRGLTLVDAIADRWGSEQDSYGTTAWFAMELDRDGEPARTG